MQVQVLLQAPGEYAHNLSKSNLRKKGVFLRAALWETADFLCKNPKCRYVYCGFGNYVTNLKKENEKLKKVNIAGIETTINFKNDLAMIDYWRQWTTKDVFTCLRYTKSGLVYLIDPKGQKVSIAKRYCNALSKD
jgi:hypothetical protein